MKGRPEPSESAERSDRAAFETLVFPHLGPLQGTALRLTRRPEEASDLVQETMLRAYRTFANFTPGTNERAWLFTIMYSIFVNSYRRRRREPDVVAVEDLEGRFEQAIELADQSAHLEILRNPSLEWRASESERALQRLPEDFRMAVLLVDVQDMSYEEAAGIMECPVGTLRSRLFRARKLLAVELLEYARSLGYVKE